MRWLVICAPMYGVKSADDVSDGSVADELTEGAREGITTDERA